MQIGLYTVYNDATIDIEQFQIPFLIWRSSTTEHPLIDIGSSLFFHDSSAAIPNFFKKSLCLKLIHVIH